MTITTGGIWTGPSAGTFFERELRWYESINLVFTPIAHEGGINWKRDCPEKLKELIRPHWFLNQLLYCLTIWEFNHLFKDRFLVIKYQTTWNWPFGELKSRIKAPAADLIALEMAETDRYGRFYLDSNNL